MALGLQCELYNAALEDRRGAWSWERRSVNYVHQCRTLTELREVRPEALDCGVTVCRGTLKRLERVFCAFYRRCARGETPGFPRFKARSRFDSLQWEDTSGWRLKPDARRVALRGIGDVKVLLHREVRGIPKAITVKREGHRWFVSIRCVEVEAMPLAPTGREVGIDLGVVNLVATSEGELVDGARLERKAAARLARAQRDLASKQWGSKRRARGKDRAAEHHRRVRNQRRDLAHKLSRKLVDDYDLIVVEDLAVRPRGPAPRAASAVRWGLRAERREGQVRAQSVDPRCRVGWAGPNARVQSPHGRLRSPMINEMLAVAAGRGHRIPLATLCAHKVWCEDHEDL